MTRQVGNPLSIITSKMDKQALKGIAAILVLAVVMGHPVSADLDPELTDQALVQALRGGGYNIYFRHAQTDWMQDDRINVAGDWTSCDPSRMRQLSQDGRQTSKAIGVAVRLLGANWDSPSGQRWTIPLGGGIGRVFKIGNQAINSRLEYYYNVEKPDGAPNQQFVFIWQFLFPKK